MRTKRSAFTLFEMVLVVAVLVVLGALAVPAILGTQEAAKGEASADAVRAAWTQARAQAMKEGRPYRFAVVWNKGNFRVAPDDDTFWGSTREQGSPNGPLVLENTLPEGMRFTESPDAGIDPTAPSGDSTCLPVGSVSGDSWVSVVVFQPDGSCDRDCDIAFQGKIGSCTTLKLNSVTGTAVSD